MSDYLNLNCYENDEGYYIDGPVKIYSMYNIFVYNKNDELAFTVSTDYESELIITGNNGNSILRENYIDEETTKNHIYSNLNRLNYSDDIIYTIQNILYPIDSTMYDSKVYCDPYFTITMNPAKKFIVRHYTKSFDTQCDYEFKISIAENVIQPNIISVKPISCSDGEELTTQSFISTIDLKNYLVPRFNKYLINFVIDYIDNLIYLNRIIINPMNISKDNKIEDKSKEIDVNMKLGTLKTEGNEVIFTSTAFNSFKIHVTKRDMSISIDVFSNYKDEKPLQRYISCTNADFYFVKKVLMNFILGTDEDDSYNSMYDEVSDRIINILRSYCYDNC